MVTFYFLYELYCVVQETRIYYGISYSSKPLTTKYFQTAFATSRNCPPPTVLMSTIV